jgi:hypothetical protein
MQGGFSKYNISHQEKAYGETHCKGHYKGRDMGLESYKPKVQHLFTEDIVIADKINENIQEGICATTCRIAESLLWQDPAEWRIKQIDE